MKPTYSPAYAYFIINFDLFVQMLCIAFLLDFCIVEHQSSKSQTQIHPTGISRNVKQSASHPSNMLQQYVGGSHLIVSFRFVSFCFFFSVFVSVSQIENAVCLSTNHSLTPYRCLSAVSILWIKLSKHMHNNRVLNWLSGTANIAWIHTRAWSGMTKYCVHFKRD